MANFKSMSSLRNDIATAIHVYLNALVEEAEDFNEDFTEQDMDRAEVEVKTIAAAAIRQFIQAQSTR